MDYKLKHQNIRTLSQLNTRSQFLKKITQLLVSISMLSLLLLSHFSNLSYLHSLTIYFPSNISLSQMMDKNTMFLLCNGLLVFMKFSGLISSSSNSKKNNQNSSMESMNHMDPYSRNYKDETLILDPEESLDKEVLFLNYEEKSPQGKLCGNYIHIEAIEEKEIMELATLQEEEEEEGEGGIESGFLVVGKGGKEMEALVGEHDQGEVEEDYVIDDKYTVVQGRSEGEEGNGLLSTEELNKSCDEFIRKMKETIRIEAQRQLVVVK